MWVIGQHLLKIDTNQHPQPISLRWWWAEPATPHVAVLKCSPSLFVCGPNHWLSSCISTNHFLRGPVQPQAECHLRTLVLGLYLLKNARLPRFRRGPGTEAAAVRRMFWALRELHLHLHLLLLQQYLLGNARLLRFQWGLDPEAMAVRRTLWALVGHHLHPILLQLCIHLLKDARLLHFHKGASLEAAVLLAVRRML